MIQSPLQILSKKIIIIFSTNNDTDICTTCSISFCARPNLLCDLFTAYKEQKELMLSKRDQMCLLVLYSNLFVLCFLNYV